MKLRILTAVFIVMVISSACTGTSGSDIVETTQEPASAQEEALPEPAETEPPAPTQVEVQETASMEAESSGEQTTQGQTGSAEKVFLIVPDETEARFLIDEVLLGAPFTVVGATSAVGGEIRADLNAPNNAQADIRVDLTTIVTDNERRNGAIQRWILETGEPANQAAEFTSVSVSGIPEQLEVGQTFDFQISGDLTVKGVTKPLTFDGTATLVSEDRLEGSASTTILYTDFTTIPSLPPQVASVEDETILEIDFVAVAE